MKQRINLDMYAACIIQQMKEEGRLGTAHVYESMLNRVKDFMAGTSAHLDDITPLWLKAFQNYLLGRQLHWNTISTYMRMLRAVYFRAVDVGLAVYRPRLFKGVYTGTRITVKRAIDEQTLQRLYGLQVKQNCPMDKARMLFLLLFMLRGIPFVDIAYLRKCDFKGNVLTYRRRKTGSWLTVEVLPQAMRLIEKLKSRDTTSPYLFPYINKVGNEAYRQYRNALRRFNALLKRLAVFADIPCSLSSYCARHSWATIANYRNYQQELISNAMGHSSVRVTETYFKRHTDEQIGQMNREIISDILVGIH